MASNSGAIRAGRAFVELFADDSKLAKGLNAASAKFTAWGSGIASAGKKLLALGSVLAAPLAAATKVAVDMGSKLVDAAGKTGVSVEALSELTFAAEQSGASFEDLTASFIKFNKNLSSNEKLFSKWGLDAAALRAKPLDEALADVADRMQSLPDAAAQTAFAMDLFSEGGVKLIRTLKDGSAGLEAARKAARDLGLTADTDSANSLNALGDAMAAVWSQAKAAAFQVGAALAPSLRDAAEWIQKVASRAISWLKENRELVVTVAKVTVGVLGAGAALVGLGSAFKVVGFAAAGLAKVWTGVGVALKLVAAAVSAIFTPWGLLIAAIAGGVGAWLAFTESGQAALDGLKGTFAAVLEEGKAAWQGISDALAAGDIALAGRIVWATLKMEFAALVNWLNKQWQDWKEYFLKLGQNAVFGVAEAAINAWALMKGTWLEVTDGMANAWDSFAAGLIPAWRSAYSWIADRLVDLAALTIDLVKKIPGIGDAFEGITIDADQLKSFINEDKEVLNKQTKDTRAKSVEDRNKRRAEAHQKIEDERAALVKSLDQEAGDQNDARAKAREESLKKTKEDLDRATQEWRDKLTEAADARAAAALEEGKKLDKGKQEFEAKSEKLSVAGTFSGTAAAMIAGSGNAIQKRQLDEQRRANDLLNDIRRNVRDNVAKFV